MMECLDHRAVRGGVAPIVVAVPAAPGGGRRVPGLAVPGGITTAVRLAPGWQRLRLTAATLKRTDSGMQFGVPAIADDVLLQINIESYPQ